MSETETDPGSDIEELEEEPEEAAPVEPPKPTFEIKSLDDIHKILVIAKGGDPNAIQAITNFMDFKSNVERSYLPNKTVTLCVGQLNGLGKVYYPIDDWDPFTLVADVLSVAFMGYKGFKSDQFVDMTRDTPNLDALQTSSEATKQGVIQRIFGGKSE